MGATNSRVITGRLHGLINRNAQFRLHRTNPINFNRLRKLASDFISPSASVPFSLPRYSRGQKVQFQFFALRAPLESNSAETVPFVCTYERVRNSEN